MKTQIINISGTHCIACKKLIEKRIMTIMGVGDVNVDFKTGKTIINADRQIDKEEINKILDNLPYEQKD